MADYLQPLPPPQVAAWYRRLADAIGRRQIYGTEPLASQMLRLWLDNRDATSTRTLAAPRHLKESQYVRDVQCYHRRVFLTEERARFTAGSARWAGVLPRLQGLPGFDRWNPTQPLSLHYQSLVEISLFEQVRGTDESRDLLTSLRGFQLTSRVVVTGAPVSGSFNVRITFNQWICTVQDRYDWDYSEHFTVPNPDFQSTAPSAVRPGDQRLTVYHSNARRVEQAGLAAPYNVEIGPWPVSDAAIIGQATVDCRRRL